MRAVSDGCGTKSLRSEMACYAIIGNNQKGVRCKAASFLAHHLKAKTLLLHVVIRGFSILSYSGPATFRGLGALTRNLHTDTGGGAV